MLRVVSHEKKQGGGEVLFGHAAAFIELHLSPLDESFRFTCNRSHCGIIVRGVLPFVWGREATPRIEGLRNMLYASYYYEYIKKMETKETCVLLYYIVEL